MAIGRTALGLLDQRGGRGDRRPLVVAGAARRHVRNRRHFRVLQEGSEEGIASNILAERLRRLVSAGLLTRAAVGRGHRATYSLTEAAIELVPLLALLGEWGLRNRPSTLTLRVEPNCSPTAVLRCGRTSWPSCAASTW